MALSPSASAKINPMKVALAQGRPQIGTWVTLIRNPAVLTLLQHTGLDFARLDMEHSSPSMETVADMAQVSRALRFPLVVRTPSADREWITRLLDVGVWGLRIPHVDTPDAARSVVEAARYAPAGMRGLWGSGAQNDFDPSVSLDDLNEQVHITVMIESPQAFEHLDEIAATPGIDAITIGPSDLAQELGVLGTASQSRVVDEYRQRLFEAAQRHGKDVDVLCGTVEQAKRWMDAGVRIIAFSSDVGVIQQAYSSAMGGLRSYAEATFAQRT